ncbi:MAG: hypothetical protein ACYCVD_07750 [Desulfitobacteriaceae bacterium]
MENPCFAHEPNTGCRILEHRCIGSNCAFFQTHEQLEASRVKANARLTGLDKHLQKHIAKKYSKGKMFWLKDGDSLDG